MRVKSWVGYGWPNVSFSGHPDDRDVSAKHGMQLLVEVANGRWRNRSTRARVKLTFKIMTDIGVGPRKFTHKQAKTWLERKETRTPCPKS